MLSLIQYPPKNKKKIRTFGFNDPMKRFAKQDNKWIFKQFGGKYHDCSSPFCYFHNIEQTLINAVSTVTTTGGGLTNREKGGGHTLPVRTRYLAKGEEKASVFDLAGASLIMSGPLFQSLRTLRTRDSK